MARRKKPKVPGIGYPRRMVDVDSFTAVGQWLVVEEIFEPREMSSGISIVRQGTATTVRGKVLRAGSECALDDVNEGDEIVFEQWSGGRHDLHGRNVLIMSIDSVLAKVVNG